MEDSDRREIRERAVRLLARREHSRHELRAKLLRREQDEAAVDEVLAELADERLLSDQRFAEAYVRARYGQGHGPLKIRAELQQRGVDDSLAAPEVNAYADDWAALAVSVRRRRFGDGAPADLRERQRQYRYLAGRGFTSEQIRHAFEDGQD